MHEIQGNGRCDRPETRGARRYLALLQTGYGPLARPFFVLGAVLLAALALGAAWLSGVQTPAVLLLQAALLAAALVLLGRLFRTLGRDLLVPLDHLRDWAVKVRGGDLAARVPLPPTGRFAELARDINRLAAQLEDLTRHMNTQVRAQTTRISRKTRSLEILYEIVASLNTFQNRDELVRSFLETLTELLDAEAASITLLTPETGLEFAASHGDMEGLLARRQLKELQCQLCVSAIADGRIKIHAVARADAASGPTHPELIVVPIQYRGVLGVYTLFLDRSHAELGDDFRDLLISVGRHVGLALEKARLDDNARRLAVMEERDILRNELHDSLAQSLVSMRLQVKMLGETLYKKDLKAAQQEVRQLRMALEEAHMSLRQLLESFRSRMDERGLIPAIDDFVQRFQQETGIATFFQHDCRELRLSPTQEVEVFRIVQEAFANIRRHSRAQTARVLLTDEAGGRYRLLVEDDGTGMDAVPSGAMQGEHQGLAIMQERSQRLGGTLFVESEPGEGTRVSLVFPARRLSPVSAAGR